MYHSQLSATPARTNVVKALTKTYVHTFSFATTVLQEYQKLTSMRMLQAFWHTPALEVFESENDQLSVRMETD